jgi:hypothetical protein
MTLCGVLCYVWRFCRTYHQQIIQAPLSGNFWLCTIPTGQILYNTWIYVSLRPSDVIHSLQKPCLYSGSRYWVQHYYYLSTRRCQSLNVSFSQICRLRTGPAGELHVATPDSALLTYRLHELLPLTSAREVHSPTFQRRPTYELITLHTAFHQIRRNEAIWFLYLIELLRCECWFEQGVEEVTADLNVTPWHYDNGIEGN